MFFGQLFNYIIIELWDYFTHKRTRKFVDSSVDLSAESTTRSLSIT